MEWTLALARAKGTGPPYQDEKTENTSFRARFDGFTRTIAPGDDLEYLGGLIGYMCLAKSPDEQGSTLLHYKSNIFSEMNGGQRIHPNWTRTSHHRPLESLLWDANRSGVLNGRLSFEKRGRHDFPVGSA